MSPHLHIYSAITRRNLSLARVSVYTSSEGRSRGDGGRSEISWEHRGHRDFQSESSCVAAIGTMCTATLSPINWLLVTKPISQELYGKGKEKLLAKVTNISHHVIRWYDLTLLCFPLDPHPTEMFEAHVPCCEKKSNSTYFKTLDNIY